jgi:hypothetical protein
MVIIEDLGAKYATLWKETGVFSYIKETVTKHSRKNDTKVSQMILWRV